MRIQHWPDDTCRQNFRTHAIVSIDIQLTNRAHSKFNNRWGWPRVSSTLTFEATHFKHEKPFNEKSEGFSFGDQLRLMSKGFWFYIAFWDYSWFHNPTMAYSNNGVNPAYQDSYSLIKSAFCEVVQRIFSRLFKLSVSNSHTTWSVRPLSWSVSYRLRGRLCRSNIGCNSFIFVTTPPQWHSSIWGVDYLSGAHRTLDFY